MMKYVKIKKYVLERGSSMRNSLKIGVFKENMWYFGAKIENNIKNKFFEADMAYDLICID